MLAVTDTAIAAQNAVTAAWSLGIGSCYIGDVLENGEKLISLLSLPPHVIPAAMVIFGYPKSKDRHQSTPRPNISSTVFMKDGYRERSLEELEDEYSGHRKYNEEHNRVPLCGKGSVADEYYSRKYTSAFMAEMNRSALMYVRRYLVGKEEK